MMDWTTLAVQIPVVAAFIWFADKMQKSFTEALDRRDALYEMRNKALVEAITANTAQLIETTKLICVQGEKIDNLPAMDRPTQPRAKRSAD